MPGIFKHLQGQTGAGFEEFDCVLVYNPFGSNFVYVIYVLMGTQVIFEALNSQIKVHLKRHISM